MKITVTQYGVTHYYAQCQQCGWSAGILSGGLDTPAAVRGAVYKHIRATGHTVVIESAKETVYAGEPPPSASVRYDG